MANVKVVDEITRYRPSRGLQSILSVTFFLIVLFMVNALAGAIWLATHNLQTDSVIFVLMFVTAGVLLLYAGMFLFAASHSEVLLGAGQGRSRAAELAWPDAPLSLYGMRGAL